MAHISFMRVFKSGNPTNFAAKLAVDSHPDNILEPIACRYVHPNEINKPTIFKQKKHTFRQSNRLVRNVGEMIIFFFWVGKPYSKGSSWRKFMKAKLYSYQKCEIWVTVYRNDKKMTTETTITIKVDGRTLSGDKVLEFIENDGFDSPEEFVMFFKGHTKGYLYHFTPMKY